MEKLSGAILYLYTLVIITLIHKCVSTPTPYWCPTGRYPTDSGQCRLCYEHCGEQGCTGPGSNLGPGGCSSCWLALEVNHHSDSYICMSPFSECPSDHYRKVQTHNGQATAVCKPCHPLCRTCSGQTVSHCETCKFFRWDGMCVRVCPPGAIVRSRRRACVYGGPHHRNRGIPAYLLSYSSRHWTRHRP